MRVVSLVPSWTEFLHDVEVTVVGQTKFCVRPPEAYRTVARVGGTKTVDLQRVMDLEPDIVVANREENDRDQVTALATALPDASVLLTDVRTVEDAWTEMRRLGRALNRPAKVNDLVDRIQTRWGAARPEAGKAGYAVWAKPWMAAGQDTFIHSVMAHWGIGNAIGAHASSDRYPTLGEDFTEGARGADVWLLPSEPFPSRTSTSLPSWPTTQRPSACLSTGRRSAGTARAWPMWPTTSVTWPIGSRRPMAEKLALRQAVRLAPLFVTDVS